MKPIQIALAPTRSRPLNMFLGVVLALVSVLFFCALATYHTSDPSWNTAADPSIAGPGAVANWVGFRCVHWRSPITVDRIHGVPAAAVDGRNGVGLDAVATGRLGGSARGGDFHGVDVCTRRVRAASVALALGACCSG
jgi:hypothetical protein